MLCQSGQIIYGLIKVFRLASLKQNKNMILNQQNNNISESQRVPQKSSTSQINWHLRSKLNPRLCEYVSLSLFLCLCSFFAMLSLPKQPIFRYKRSCYDVTGFCLIINLRHTYFFQFLGLGTFLNEDPCSKGH